MWKGMGVQSQSKAGVQHGKAKQVEGCYYYDCNDPKTSELDWF